MDRAQSARKYDLNGWFEVPNNPISKEGIFPYSGAQVGAPDAERIYRVYRPAEELGHEEALASFRLLPIIDDHTMLGEGFTPADEAGVSGVIGENVRFENGTLLANLKIYDGALAQKIKSGKTELSCGYRCVYDFTPGFWNGQPYDAVQRQIRGNHLALVDEGRMGPGVRVMDHMVFTADAKEILPVDEELKKVLDAMAATVKDLSDRMAKLETPAADEDKPATEEPAKDEDMEAEAEVSEDMEEPAKDGDYKAMDALTKTVKALAAKVDKLASKPVMDEAAVVATLADKTDLANRLAQHVGVFDHSKMTHAQVVAYGVEKLALKVKPGGEAIALDAALQVKAKPTAAAAMDAANQVSPLRASIAKYNEGK
jgi:hypothetical protein